MQTAKDSLETAGGVAREAAGEARAQARSPELREPGHDASRVAGRAAESVKGAAHEIQARAGEKVDGAKDAVHSTVSRVKESYQSAKDGVRVRASAVKGSARRARVAPRKIAHELGDAFASWKRALITSIAMAAGLFVLGIVTLVVLTIAMVAGLN